MKIWIRLMMIVGNTMRMYMTGRVPFDNILLLGSTGLLMLMFLKKASKKISCCQRRTAEPGQKPRICRIRAYIYIHLYTLM